MNTKEIEFVKAPPKTHMVGNGFRVHNFIPGDFRLTMERMDPFIVLDYNSKYYFPPTENLRGVGVHPHRGFETVTIAYQGSVAHNDSAGNSGVIHKGDVQWMTAASGILHKEYHEQNFSRQGGDFQMVQLWVNLPAKDKMNEPKYQGITQAQMPKVKLPNDLGFVEIIAGEFQGKKGPAQTHTPLHLQNAKLKKGGQVQFEFPVHYNTAILIVEGKVNVNHNTPVEQDHFVLFKNQGEIFTLEALEDCIVLVMSGEPINEPIFAHGPFVMNSRDEIIQAFEDYNLGKFGYLE